jgi:hypothetical protein
MHSRKKLLKTCEAFFSFEFQEWRRVLRPGNVFAFSSSLPEHLFRIVARDALASIE